MKVLLVSQSGAGTGLADRLALEGNQVKVFIKKAGMSKVGLGLYQRVTSWRPHAQEWADLILSDEVGMGHVQGLLDRWEVPNLGFNPFADMLEQDILKQRRLLEKLGMPLTDAFTFESPAAAREINDVYSEYGLMIRPIGSVRSGRTFVTHGTETYRWALEQFTGDQQLFISVHLRDVVRVSVESWFNGTEFLTPFYYSFTERDAFGDVGNMLISVPEDDPHGLIHELRKLGPWLQGIKYRGPCSLDAVITKEGLSSVEAKASFRFHAIEALGEWMDEPIGEFLWALILGRHTEGHGIKVNEKETSISMKMDVPPSPVTPPEPRDAGLPFSFPKKRRKHYWVGNAYQDGELLRWAAGDAPLLKVTAKARGVASAAQLVGQRCAAVSCMNLHYPVVIGKQTAEALEQLEEWKTPSETKVISLEQKKEGIA